MLVRVAAMGQNGRLLCNYRVEGLHKVYMLVQMQSHCSFSVNSTF